MGPILRVSFPWPKIYMAEQPGPNRDLTGG